MKKKTKIWIFTLAQRFSSTRAIRFTSPFSYFPDDIEFTFVPSFRALATLAAVPDVVMFHRILYPFPEVYKILDFCRQYGVLTGLEVDDLIVAVPPENPSYPGYFPLKAQIEDFIRRMDFLIVSTQRLRQFLLAYNQNIYFLPNLVDRRIWGAPVKEKKSSDQIVIGYCGSTSHSYDFKSVTPAIRHILEKYRGRVLFKFVGCVPEGLRGLANIIHTEIIEPYDQYARFVKNSRFDIAIAVLEDNEFSQSKSNIKFLEYSICGYPGIYSRVGPYVDSVEHNETGLLIGNTVDEWITAMERLIEDEQLRKRIGAKAYECVTQKYSLQKRFSEWIDTYRVIVDQRRNKNNIVFSFTPVVSFGPYMAYAQFREFYYDVRRLFRAFLSKVMMAARLHGRLKKVKLLFYKG
jgi:glycosyltransferase involved in cell wall biosynthesis